MGLSPEYRAWRDARSRCHNPNVKNYHRYGGRGITFSSRWDSFETFLEDMGSRPSKEYSLDRIDNNLGYTPENCRWSTIKEQANNRRVRRDNSGNGLSGVAFQKHRDRWHVSYKGKFLGCTRDFFEACCVRKRAEYAKI